MGKKDRRPTTELGTKGSPMRVIMSTERHGEMENIINRSSVIVFLWRADEGSPVDYVSSNISQFGYTAEEFISGSIPYVSIIHPEDRKRIVDESSRYQREGLKEFTQEYRIITKTGEVRWIEDKTKVRCGPQGVITHHEGIITDVTERKNMVEELQRNSLLLDNATDFIALHDLEGNFVYVNEMMSKSLGYTREELLSMNLNQLDEQGSVDLGKSRVEEMFEKGSVTFEETNRRKDGFLIPVEVHDRVIQVGKRKLILGVVRDITRRKKSEEKLKLDADILNNTTDSILVHDLEGDMVYVNDTACDSLGYTREELINLKPYKLSPQEDAERFRDRMNKLLEKKSTIDEVTFLRKDGAELPVELHGRIIELGSKELVLAVVRDISERKKMEEHIRQLAYHDSLTGLPNRSLLTDHFHLAQAHAIRYKHLLVLMMMDLDKFKDVNDNLGHSAGDRLLKEVSMRLVESVRKTDTVARMGGDEFVLLLQEINSEGDTSNIARKILEVMRKPFELEGHKLNVTTSIGIAFYPCDGDDMDSLVKHADFAMYRVKEQGRNSFLRYTPDMDTTRAKQS
jgi:diguanylate cyclase (GGDEF)-like protein/PAS domain S-box-containing protein